VGVSRIPGTHNVIEQAPQFSCNWTHDAVADRAMIDLGHSGHLDGGAGHEQFLANVDLGAIDWSFDHWQFHFILSQFHDRATGDAFQDILSNRRRDEAAVADHENIHGTAFGDMSFLGEDEGIIEPGSSRIGFDQGGIGIGTADLATGGDHIVIHSPPGGDSEMGGGVILDVQPEWQGKHGEIIQQTVQFNTDGFVRFVRQRANIDILPVTVLAQEVQQDGSKTLRGLVNFDAHETTGI